MKVLKNKLQTQKKSTQFTSQTESKAKLMVCMNYKRLRNDLTGKRKERKTKNEKVKFINHLQITRKAVKLEL